MRNTKLELYYEDIDSIVDMVKENLGYDHFTVSSKKSFDPVIDDCLFAAKDAISNIYTDTEEAVHALAIIQERFEKVITNFRIIDEQLKQNIYKMTPGLEIDSIRPYIFKESDWISVIKA